MNDLSLFVKIIAVKKKIQKKIPMFILNIKLLILKYEC